MTGQSARKKVKKYPVNKKGRARNQLRGTLCMLGTNRASLSVMCHYGVRYGVRLYGTVRKYGVQPYLYGLRPFIR